MPLLVTDHSWTQTDSAVHIKVPLKGAAAAKVDVLSTDEYLKVHFPPFLFEVFLSEPVDEARGSARIGDGAAVISLPKRTSGPWEQLGISSYDKEKKKEIRERALLKHREKLNAESEAKAEKKHTENKYTLETMMKLERDERGRIQKMKDDERARTTAELERWQLREERRAEEEAQLRRHSQRANQSQPEKGTRGNAPPVGGRAGRDEDERRKNIYADVPEPRVPGNIQVTFTPRAFVTALRESKVPEEEEWLQKQAEARRAINADLEELKDLKDEERNPDWLKEKGNKCFATGNYLGALNAYNLAIRLNRQIPALYSNRAACHLKLRNLHKAVEDSSRALELLTPPVSANAAARARAHVRRGSAFCELQLYAEGLQDYQAALKIDPDNAALQADAQRIREIVQGSVAEPGTH